MTHHISPLLVLLFVCTLPILRAQSVTVTIDDSTGGEYHVHPIGAVFTIKVTASWSGGGGVYWQWQDADKRPMGGGPTRLQSGVQATITSPSGLLGYIQLMLTADSPLTLPNRNAGEALSYGFASVDARPKTIMPNSYFGIVQGSYSDPYVGPWVKDIWWPGHNPATWLGYITNSRANGKINMGLITGTSADGSANWNTQPDDNSRIGQAQLNALQANVQTYWQQCYANGANAEYGEVELGIEENLGANFRQTFYFENLAAKARVVKAAAAAVSASLRFGYQVVGSDPGTTTNSDFYRFLSSPAAAEFQILEIHPYAWADFVWPDIWMPNLITTITGWMRTLNRVMPIHFSEIGLPVNDPPVSGFNSNGSPVPGSTKGYAASYLLRCYVIGISLGVEHILWYNYQDRFFSRTDVEANFGMRDNGGYAEPMYATFWLLQTYFDNPYVGQTTLPGNVQVYKFQGNGNDIYAVWTYPSATTATALSAIKAGLTDTQLSVCLERTGRPCPLSGQSLTVTDAPIILVTPSVAPTTAATTTAAVTSTAAAAVALSTANAAAATTAAAASTTSAATTVAATAAAAAAANSATTAAAANAATTVAATTAATAAASNVATTAAASAAASSAATTTATAASANAVAAASTSAASTSSAASSFASTAVVSATTTAASATTSNAATSAAVTAAASAAATTSAASAAATTAATAAVSNVATTAAASASVTASTTVSTTAAVASSTSTSAATTNAAAGTVAGASATSTASASASAASVAATTSAVSAASVAAAAATASATASVSASVAASTSGGNAVSTTAATTAAASTAVVAATLSVATTSNVVAASAAASQAASTAAASAGGASGSTAVASATTSVASTASTAAAQSTSTVSASGITTATSNVASTAAASATTSASTSIAATAAAAASTTTSGTSVATATTASTGGITGTTSTPSATTGAAPQPTWYILIESTQCLDLEQLFASLAAALDIPNDRFQVDSYDGCRRRNSLLVMHVSNDPDGSYARRVVNYLLSGAWPNVASTSVTQTKPTPKKDTGLKWWVFAIIGVVILIVIACVIGIACLVVRRRDRKRGEGRYVQMLDKNQRIEETLYGHGYM